MREKPFQPKEENICLVEDILEHYNIITKTQKEGKRSLRKKVYANDKKR